MAVMLPKPSKSSLSSSGSGSFSFLFFFYDRDSYFFVFNDFLGVNFSAYAANLSIA